jgi:hypothetical protein
MNIGQRSSINKAVAEGAGAVRGPVTGHGAMRRTAGPPKVFLEEAPAAPIQAKAPKDEIRPIISALSGALPPFGRCARASHDLPPFGVCWRHVSVPRTQGAMTASSAVTVHQSFL